MLQAANTKGPSWPVGSGMCLQRAAVVQGRWSFFNASLSSFLLFSAASAVVVGIPVLLLFFVVLFSGGASYYLVLFFNNTC